MTWSYLHFAAVLWIGECLEGPPLPLIQEFAVTERHLAVLGPLLRLSLGRSIAGQQQGHVVRGLQEEVDEAQPHLPQVQVRVAAVLPELEAAARARPIGVEDGLEVLALVEGAEEAELEGGGLAVDDLVHLGRQLVRHRLVLGPPQHPPRLLLLEGRQQVPRPGQVALGGVDDQAALDGSDVDLPERAGRAEAAGIGPVEHAPQLIVLVLQQRSGQPDAAPAAQALERLRHFRLGVLDPVHLVDDDAVPVDAVERVHVLPRRLEGRQHDLHAADPRLLQGSLSVISGGKEIYEHCMNKMAK